MQHFFIPFCSKIKLIFEKLTLKKFPLCTELKGTHCYIIIQY